MDCQHIIILIVIIVIGFILINKYSESKGCGCPCLNKYRRQGVEYFQDPLIPPGATVEKIEKFDEGKCKGLVCPKN